MATSKKKPPKWLGATVAYEGIPLLLRVRPKIDSKTNRASFTGLVCVTHLLTRVRQDGLPEPDYNETLLDLDLAILAAVESKGKGLTVLIETFAGRRNYYGYLVPKARITDEIRDLKKRFPGHKITLQHSEDPEWKLYQRYRRLFPWD